MSDSECDLLQNNFYTFQHESSTISAKGPNVNKTLTNFGRNNMLTSTMLMPKNIERSALGEQSYYHNSIYNRRDRDTSPASIRSVPTLPQQYFTDVYHRGNPYSHQKPIVNVRGGSPMSIRTIDSNSSMRAVDIAMALKEGQFNKYDLRIIKEAYHNLVKSKMRRRIEKKRKKRFRSTRRNSCDSGEQGSDSSVSSVDCKSMKTTSFKDNMSSCRSTRTDISYLRNTIKESNIYRDCTENLKQNTFRNNVSTGSQSVYGDYRAVQGSFERQNSVKNALSTGAKSVHGDFRGIGTAYDRPNTHKNYFSVGTQSINGDYRGIHSRYEKSQFKAPRSVCSDIINKKTSMPVLRDRFKNSFLLPSHRFNKSVASMTIPENLSRELCDKPANQRKTSSQRNKCKEMTSLQSKQITSYPNDSDEDDMFPQITQNRLNQTKNRKRSLDNDDINKTPNKKQKDNISPKKKLQSNTADIESICTSNSDFNFIKPSLPAKKSLNGKTNEVIIARSASTVDYESPPTNLVKTKLIPAAQQEESSIVTQSDTSNDKHVETSQNSSTDVSTRPSFIKRKLFSQKLDVTEAKDKTDSSSESPQVDSYKSLIRERNKARKLVINNSCLNRDITGVNNNLLDLIHKIVPAEQMNMTNVANQTNKNETKNTTDPEDKWDVTSVISTCNNKDNVSDTFTDDELFGFTIKTDKKNVKRKEKANVVTEPQKGSLKTTVVAPCKVVMKPQLENTLKNAVEHKKISFSCVDNFFDTDYETDSESRNIDKLSTSKPMAKDAQPKEFIQKANESVKHNNSTINKTLNKNQKTKEVDISLGKLVGKEGAGKPRLKPIIIKLHKLKQNSESSIKTKDNKHEQKIDSNKNIKTLDQNKAIGINETDKKCNTKNNVTDKEKSKVYKHTENDDVKQKSSGTTQNKNSNEAEKMKPQVENQSNKQKMSAPFNKAVASTDKHISKATAKIQEKNSKQSENNIQKNYAVSNKTSVFNNSRSRRIRTPTSQKENIPSNNIKTRSGNKSNKKTVSNKSKQIMQESFTLLENNNKKKPENKTTEKLYAESSLNTSMTLRSRSLQESDEIAKTKNKKNNGKICENKTSKPHITKIEAKIQTVCNTSMSLRVRKNAKKDISYVY